MDSCASYGRLEAQQASGLAEGGRGMHAPTRTPCLPGTVSLRLRFVAARLLWAPANTLARGWAGAGGLSLGLGHPRAPGPPHPAQSGHPACAARRARRASRSAPPRCTADRRRAPSSPSPTSTNLSSTRMSPEVLN